MVTRRRASCVLDQRARHAAACTAACDSAGVSGRTRWRMRWRWWGPGSRPLHCRCRCHDLALSIASAPAVCSPACSPASSSVWGSRSRHHGHWCWRGCRRGGAAYSLYRGGHCSRTLGYLSRLVGRGCNSSGQGSGRGGQARNQRWGTRRRGTRRVWWEVGSAVGMEHHTSAASGISGGAPSGLQQRPRQTSPRARSRRHYRRRRGPRCKLQAPSLSPALQEALMALVPHPPLLSCSSVGGGEVSEGRECIRRGWTR